MSNAPGTINAPHKQTGLPADLREQIKQARAQKGWGQRQLGAAVDLPQSHISAIEAGRIVPRFDTLLEIVRALNMDLLLVPSALVPAVQSLLHTQGAPSVEEKPLYAVSEDELQGGEHDEH